jgi:hypothetical protein
MWTTRPARGSTKETVFPVERLDGEEGYKQMKGCFTVGLRTDGDETGAGQPRVDFQTHNLVRMFKKTVRDFFQTPRRIQQMHESCVKDLVQWFVERGKRWRER